mgnify:CR=1 FL=1
MALGIDPTSLFRSMPIFSMMATRTAAAARKTSQRANKRGLSFESLEARQMMAADMAEIVGTIRGIDFVNPHSYLNLDVRRADGALIAMRCEMRAATLLRRSGWRSRLITGAERWVNRSSVSPQRTPQLTLRW